jgi:hypothetical protein
MRASTRLKKTSFKRGRSDKRTRTGQHESANALEKINFKRRRSDKWTRTGQS